MLFPQSSVTLYVLTVVSVHPTNAGVPSLTQATVGVPQLSASSVTTEISGAGNAPLQPVRLISAGLLAVGSCVSTVRIRFCTTLMLLPQSSVTLYVLTVVSVHPTNEGVPSLTHATVGVPQLSASSVTTEISGAGNAPLQPVRLISAGLLAVGSCVSTVRIRFCTTLMLLPQSSVTLYVLTVVSVHPTNEGVPSLTHSTVGVPQLSASSVTTEISGAGMLRCNRSD